MADAAVEFLALARALREAGETGLKKELYKALDDTAADVIGVIKSIDHLHAYMPDRYADVFAEDLRVIVSKRTTGTEPGVRLQASAPTRRGSRGRKIRQREAGAIDHPVFADSLLPRRQWEWRTQTAGMRAGFFGDPVEAARPELRRQIEQAIRRVRDKIYAAR